MNKLAEQSETFKRLLNEIGEEIALLKTEIKDLKRENGKLRSKLEQNHEKQTDIFSVISESERLALRQHIQGLVTKIDKHLNPEA